MTKISVVMSILDLRNVTSGQKLREKKHEPRTTSRRKLIFQCTRVQKNAYCMS